MNRLSLVVMLTIGGIICAQGWQSNVDDRLQTRAVAQLNDLLQTLNENRMRPSFDAQRKREFSDDVDKYLGKMKMRYNTRPEKDVRVGMRIAKKYYTL